VQSEQGPEVTIIDGHNTFGPIVTFQSGETQASRLSDSDYKTAGRFLELVFLYNRLRRPSMVARISGNWLWWRDLHAGNRKPYLLINNTVSGNTAWAGGDIFIDAAIMGLILFRT